LDHAQLEHDTTKHDHGEHGVREVPGSDASDHQAQVARDEHALHAPVRSFRARRE
jgi:hypothetical protein